MVNYDREQFARECLERWQESLKGVNKDIKKYRKWGKECPTVKFDELLDEALKSRRWHYRTIKHWKNILKE